MSCLIRSLQPGPGQSLEVSVRQTSDGEMVCWAPVVVGKEREAWIWVICVPFGKVINFSMSCFFLCVK